ncbi:MAG: hypothetical protein IMW90_12895 [Thermogemmatispora sp.]|uniref:hypothetical protein n=1 Tax=Thermogemmatispora sp. TaxID=1968838 RepID=UPI0019EA7CED|nr:hypothetical protein [Thermogemmatispora sp.]MBE3566615.1 hypothetical protein [Thermogemmatispora sp.]
MSAAGATSSAGAANAGRERERAQEPFKLVSPVLRASLLIGSGGGFLLAAVLTVTQALHLAIATWWSALVQAHGHLQLYGWAALFVIGVSFHFLPRLRGTALPLPRLVPWILGLQIGGLLLRALAQPLLTLTGPVPLLWRLALVVSGGSEGLALLLVAAEYLLLLRHGPALSTRKAFLGIAPFISLAALALAVAAILNLVNMLQAATQSGLAPQPGDDLNVSLGLFGFLISFALAVSAQSLPMYAGLEAFPRPILWPLAGGYGLGLLLFCLGLSLANGAEVTVASTAWPLRFLEGPGLLLLGGVIAGFVTIFISMMRRRGRLPAHVAALSPSPEALARTYRRHTAQQSQAYGPFVVLIASAYLWAFFSALLLISAGLILLWGSPLPFSLDVPRHGLAMGFITLLICGIAPRMVPGFSGGTITSPRLVAATLWLGNLATALRVFPLLLASPLGSLWSGSTLLLNLLFALSGPSGLATVVCLACNLWPALRSRGGKS